MTTKTPVVFIYKNREVIGQIKNDSRLTILQQASKYYLVAVRNDIILMIAKAIIIFKLFTFNLEVVEKRIRSS